MPSASHQPMATLMFRAIGVSLIVVGLAFAAYGAVIVLFPSTDDFHYHDAYYVFDPTMPVLLIVSGLVLSLLGRRLSALICK